MFIQDGVIYSRITQNLVIADIVVIKGMGNYSKICLKNGEYRVASRTLKVFEELLNEFDFLRPSKFCLVNMQYLVIPAKQVVSHLTLLHTTDRIAISRRKIATVNELLRNRRLIS
jgi:DNA-binding LytR/AlgR family response regulator